MENFPMNKSSEDERRYLLGIGEKVISPHVEVMYVRRGISKHLHPVEKRWKLHIVIDEDTIIEELKLDWSEILKYRDQLKIIQGSDPKSFPTIIMEYIYSQIISAPHYSDILREMNFYALVYLMWSIADRVSDEDRSYGLYYFRQLLKAFQIKDKGIQQWENKGVTCLQKNDLPWGLIDGPITKRRGVDSIRNYKRRLEDKTVVNLPSINSEALQCINYLSIVRGYWQKIESLLKENNPDQYTDFEHQINGFYNETLTVVRVLNEDLEELGMTVSAKNYLDFVWDLL
jgi:hypothetical protein